MMPQQPGLPSVESVPQSDDSVDDNSSNRSTGSSSTYDGPIQPTARKDGSVRVAVRIRPLLPKEVARNEHVCVQYEDNTIQFLDSQKQFTFDYVFPLPTTQADLYEEALQPLMDSFLQGFNVTVIAYGQTGSGKTFTMGNNMPSSAVLASQLFSSASVPTVTTREEDVNSRGDILEESAGLIPRFLHQLFRRLKEADGSDDASQVSVSFLEIYGEEIHDLLHNSKINRNDGTENLLLREGKAGVWVQGLTEIKVKTQREAMEQMQQGSLRRITGSTEMNEHSSRSHAIYTVKIVRRVKGGESFGSGTASTLMRATKSSSSLSTMQTGKVKKKGSAADLNRGSETHPLSDGEQRDATIVSKLTFVDLAGSERLKKTQAEGNRMKEGIQINVGLLALGNVINALGDERRRGTQQPHVPYRSSKLTRLLQDALGGNSRTLFIACVSPAETNASETLNTLQYANRAKNIQNKAIKNIDSRSAELLGLKALNELLRRELVKARFIRLPDADPSQIENMVDAMLKHPSVLTYLKELEQLAATSGLDSFDRNDETSVQKGRLLLEKFSAQLFGLVSGNNPQNCHPLTRRELQGHDEMDILSDGGSSVALMEENMDEDLDERSRYSVYQLSRTLEVITLTLEIQDTKREGECQKAAIEAKIAEIEIQLHRAEFIKKSIDQVVATITVRNDAENQEQQQRLAGNLGALQKKSDAINSELTRLLGKKNLYEKQLESLRHQHHKEIRFKLDCIEQLRQSREHMTTSNPLDILIRTNEIKHRFKVRELMDASSYLEGQEKAMAASLDEDTPAVAHLTSLFSSEEISSSSAHDLFLNIQEKIQSTLDEEEIRASLLREARHRSQILRAIASDKWKPEGYDASNLTPQELLAMNDEILNQCQENITCLTEALYVLNKTDEPMSTIVDCVTSMDNAKCVMKMLIDEIYTQRRLYLALLMKDDSQSQKNGLSTLNIENVTSTEGGARLLSTGPPVTRRELESELEKKAEEYQKELHAALEVVNSFAIAQPCPTNPEQVAYWMQKCAASESKAAVLEDKVRELDQRIANETESSLSMKAQLTELESRLNSSKMKEEAFQLLESCQNIWRELGMDEGELAEKFRDINDSLVKRCSEELEVLEASREKIQAQIDEAYRLVKQLECVLLVDNPVDIQMLRELSGKTLFEQFRYLMDIQKKLADELRQRLHDRIRSVNTIRELMECLQLTKLEDFRHITKEETHQINLNFALESIKQVAVWKQYQQSSPSSSSLQILLDSFSSPNAANITSESLKQDQILVDALYTEKKKRITEAEELMNLIRASVQKMHLTQEEVLDVLRTAFEDFVYKTNGRLNSLVQWIFQDGGNVDVTTTGLVLLSGTRDALDQVFEHRCRAIAFFDSTTEEAHALMRDIIGNPEWEYESPLKRQHRSAETNQISHDIDSRKYRCTREELMAGKRRLDELSDPIEQRLRTLLFSLNDDFTSYGMDTDDKRVVFFLGKNKHDDTKRRTLERYITFANVTGRGSSTLNASSTHLSKFDPEYEELGATYSEAYGQEQLQRVKSAIEEASVVQSMVEKAQERLESLQKFWKYHESKEDLKKEAADFEIEASDKARLKGSSLVLLNQEKYRKSARKRLTNLQAMFKKEGDKWLTDDGDYDLDLLGEDMKNSMLDMMNIDTSLMHLDLSGLVDTSRTSVRRDPTRYLTPTQSSSNLNRASKHVNPNASAPARTRSLSTIPRDPNAKKKLFE